MTSNLTRDEAAERARLLRVESYQVELDLTGGETTFGSVTTVRFGCQRAGVASFIDLTAPEVTEAVLNGRTLPADAFDGNRIALDELAGANELTVRAQCQYSRSSEGLHRFTDPADKGVYLYSDLETFDAHRIYACFDQPDLKATYEFDVRCPDTWQVISNMAPSIGGEPADLGVERWHFPPTPLMSTYITHISAGPYHFVRSEHDGIPLGIFCRQSLASYLDPDEIFEITRQGFDYFHRAFGVRYAFGKYDQLFVPEYKSGAMENAGAVTFLEDYIFRSRVTDARHDQAEHLRDAHVVRRPWCHAVVDDLWLNRSFAHWAGLVAKRGQPAGPTPDTFRGPWRHGPTGGIHSLKPIRSPPTSSTSGGRGQLRRITMPRGASVLRGLCRLCRPGELPGWGACLLRRAPGATSSADLLDALARTSGRELTSWSRHGWRLRA